MIDDYLFLSSLKTKARGEEISCLLIIIFSALLQYKVHWDRY